MNVGDDCTMTRVVMTGYMQMCAAKFPTVSRPSKEVITLGGYPPPTSSHPPCLLPSRGTTRLLLEVLGQIGEAHHVLPKGAENGINLLVPVTGKVWHQL